MSCAQCSQPPELREAAQLKIVEAWLKKMARSKQPTYPARQPPVLGERVVSGDIYGTIVKIADGNHSAPAKAMDIWIDTGADVIRVRWSDVRKAPRAR